MANTTRRNSSDRDRRDSGVRSSYAARSENDSGKKTQNKTTNNHEGQKRSGLNRDQYDSAVRSSYSARAAADSAKARANNQVSEQEFNRSTSMQRSYGNYQNYQQGRKVTAGGFYSKPTPSQETTAAMQLTKTMSEAIGENRKKNYLVELAKKIGYKPEWTADAAQRNQTEYEKLYARYQEAWAKSEPLYEAFLKDEEQWRQTIRGKDEVAADVERINQLLKPLREKQMQLEFSVNNVILSGSQMVTPATQGVANRRREELEAVRAQVRELEEQLALVGEEQGWEFYYRYEKYKADPDFALKSQYTSEPTGERIPTTEEQMMAGNPKTPKLWKSISYEMINGNQDAIGIIRTVLDYDYTGDELGEHLRGYEDGRQVALGMKDEERATFNYLYHARGAQAAAEYFYELEAIALNTRFREKKEEWARAFAQEYPVAANVYSVVVSNLTKPVTFLNQVLDYADDGKLVKDAPYNKHSYVQSAIRNETSKDWHPVAQFAYQTGMSLADFAYTAMITGGLSKSGTAASTEFAKNLSLAIMGSGAAADTVLAAKDRGLNDQQAMTLGTVAGMAEILTEKFSIDTLLEGLGSNKGIVYILKNMGAEGSEEMASDLINLVADVVVSKTESEWYKAVEEGMEQGLTEQEAFSRAFAAEAINIGLSGLGGVVSGGAMGVGYIAYSKVVENSFYNKGMKMIGQGLVTEEGRPELLETVKAGLQLEKDSPAYKQAKAINDKIEKGKKISALEAGRMYTAVSAAEEANLREQAEKGAENARPSDPGMENGTEKARATEPVTAGTPTKVSGDYVAVKYTPREVTQGMTEQEATGARWGVNEETVKRVGNVSRLLGVNVVWYREGPENGQIKDGYYNRETGKIYLNADSPNPTMQIISHELTHALEGTRSYGDFYRLILGEMTDLDTQVQDKIAAYAGAGITLNSDGAKKEIVAHYVQTTLLTDEQAIRRIVRKNTGFGRWMMNSIDKLLAKLGNTHAKERLKLRRASDLYAKALREFQKESKYLEGTDGRLTLQKAEYTAEDAERARRSLDEAFERGEITEEELATAMDEIDSALEESEGRAAALAERTQHSVSEDGRLKLPKVEADQVVHTDAASYSISSTLESDLNKVLNNTFRSKNNEVYIGETSNFLTDVIGAKALRMTMPVGKAYAAMVTKERALAEDRYDKDYNYHNLGVAGLMMALEKSENPIVAFEGMDGKERRLNGNIVLVTDMVHKGNNVVVVEALHTTGHLEGKIIKVNKAITSYDRESISKDVEEAERKGRLLYLDKKRSQDLAGMPAAFPQGSIQEVDFKKNIQNFWMDVKWIRSGNTQYSSGPSDDGGTTLSYAFNNPGKLRTKSNRSYSVSEETDGRIHLPAVEPVEETAQDTASGETDGKVRLPMVESVEETAETSQFSVSKALTEQKTAKKPFDRKNIPWKWRPEVSRAERHFAGYMGNVLGVPDVSGRDFLTKIGEKLTEELLTTDKISIPQMFKTTYEQAMAHNAEFIEKYKGVGTWIATTPITPSVQDRGEMYNFDTWVKKAGKKLKIADKGGISIEDAYAQLQKMAPDLFPEDDAWAEEKGNRILKVVRGLEAAERSLDKFQGSRRLEHKRAAKVKFDDAIRRYKDDMKYARRHEAGRTQSLPPLQTPTTVDEALELQRQIKQVQAECDRVLAKHPLNQSDRDAVDKLLQGKIKPKDIKRRSNFEGILAVYEARKEVEDRKKPWKKWQEEQRGKKDRIAEEAITEEDIQFMKDKGAGILYARETMQRNNEDVMPPEVARKVNALFFDTIRKSEKKANEFKTAARERVKKMKLSRDVEKGNLVSESHAVQLYGEAISNIEIIQNSKGRIKMRDGRTLEEWQEIVVRLWLENPKLDKVKIQNAVQEFRAIYDKLLELMNWVRVQNGYEPVRYREGYFPHFQPGGDGIMAQFAAALGITMDVTALPTTINGLTYTFNPGITWFGNTMERLGFATAYDAVEGFDKYIEGVSNVIFFTENIQMLRALERRIRYLASPEGIRKQIKAIQESEMTEAEQQTEIAKIMKEAKFGLSNYVNNLHEYTNLLAGKKSMLDRDIEALIGRRWYNLAKAWEKRIGANMVGANFGSALTNFIPLQQAGAQLPAGTIMKAMLETMKNMKDSDGIAERSAFISNRKGSDPIVKTWVEKASGKMSLPMEYIDSFVAETIVRAKYGQNIKAGMSEEAAMDDADAWAARIMAERSKGGMPTLFASTNPIVKLFTQFQLEVNNEFSMIFKDIPRANREKKLRVLAAILLRYVFGGFLFNEIYEFFVGRRPALDPLNIINETVGDFTGYELPNLVGMAADYVFRGEKPDFTTQKEKPWKAAGNLLVNLAEKLPFSSAVALVTDNADIGRISAGEGIPNVWNIGKALLDEDMDGKAKAQTAHKELMKLAYVVPPFGGSQLAKMVKGIRALAKGGSYSVNRDGEDLLQYPVYKDSVGDKIMSAGQMLLFGKSATREAQEWVDSGFQSLNAKETAVYQDLTENGMKERDAFEFIKSLQGQEEKRQAIIDSDVSEEAKVIAFYGLMASKEERAFLDDLDQRGFDGVACAGAMLNASVAETKEDKLDAMAGRDLEPEAYVEIADKVGILSSDKQRETMDSLAEQGQDMERCAELLVDIVAAEKRADKLALIRDADLDREAFEEYAAFIIGSKERETETGNRTQFAKLIDAVDGGLDQRTAVQMQIDGHDLEKVINLMEAGMKPATAANVIRNVGELEPEEGYDDVQAAQKWRACVDAASNPKDQIEALRVIMNKDTFKKVEMGYDSYNIPPEAFVRLKERLPEFDEDGNGSFKQSEVTAAMAVLFPINVLPGGNSLSNDQKAALWQLWTGSKSAKNNPYSRSVGQQVIDARNAAKEAEEAEEEEEKDYRLRLPR